MINSEHSLSHQLHERYLESYGAALISAKNGERTVILGEMPHIARKVAHRAVREAYAEVGGQNQGAIATETIIQEDTEQFLQDFRDVYETLLDGSRTINVPYIGGHFNSNFRRAAVEACKELGVPIEQIQFVGDLVNTENVKENMKKGIYL